MFLFYFIDRIKSISLKGVFILFINDWTIFALAFATSFLIMLIFGKLFISSMIKWQKKGQPISENVPESHVLKSGTPTMGGLLLIVSILISSIIFMDFSNPMPWIALGSLVIFGLIGFLDDYKKVTKQSKKASNGLSRHSRLIFEGLGSILLAYFVNKTIPYYVPEYSIYLPFGIIISSCFWYFVFAYFVITGTANATNISDGLDGMLSKLYLPVLLVLLLALYYATGFGVGSGLFLPTASGLYPVFGAIFGSILGFLWFNSTPASIFMGDTGSLALGGILGTISMLLKSEIIMGIASMMMVIILLSSFIQIFFFKITRKITGIGKRVFLMAPLHHHFEMKGYKESKISERFFIISIIFSVFAFILIRFM